MIFTDIDQTLEINGFTVTARIEQDSDCGTPWDNCEGHGPVSNWTRAAKEPGQLVLCADNTSKRFYDYHEACKIARRDRWGVSPSKKYIEQGANGLVKLSGHWFDARNNLTAIATDWHDDINEAYSELYTSHRATMSKREYAALAAMQDYQRLRDFLPSHRPMIAADIGV